MAAPDATDDLQLWTFTHQGGDIYQIENVGDNTLLGIKDGWCGVFGDVQVGFDASSPYIYLKVSPASATDTYVFEIAFDADCNFGSTNTPVKAFDIDGGNSEAKIQTYDVDTTNPNQQLQIVEPSALSMDEASKILNSINAIYNSTSRDLALKTNQSIKISSMEIYHINGRIIGTNENVHSEGAEFNFNAYSNGIYLIKIVSDKAQVVKKLVVY